VPSKTPAGIAHGETASEVRESVGAVRRPRTLRSIRAYCLWCADGQAGEVRECPAAPCSLWPYRFGHNPRFTTKGSAAGLAVSPGMTAQRAVAFRCCDCYERSPHTCPAAECPLYAIRPKGRLRSAKATRERICRARAAAP
jgi:hypothetical protein